MAPATVSRPVSGNGTPPPTAGGALLLNHSSSASPKTATKLRSSLLSSSGGRLRSKESSPDVSLNVTPLPTPPPPAITLEKRILDAVALLSQNKYTVLDDGQQKAAAGKLLELETEAKVQRTGVAALGVLVNYLVTDVSTFAYQ